MFWRSLRVRLNLHPSFGVKESDFRFHILYQCIICTNSRSAPVGKHSDETAPTPLERGFAETAPTCNSFARDVTILFCRLLLHLRPNYIHSASNDIHTDGPRARARAKARARYSENLLIQHIS